MAVHPAMRGAHCRDQKAPGRGNANIVSIDLFVNKGRQHIFGHYHHDRRVLSLLWLGQVTVV